MSLAQDGGESARVAQAAPDTQHRSLASRAVDFVPGILVVAFVVVAVVGFVLLAALTVLAGWLLKTYVLPDHGIGHADEHVNVWLAARRTATWNDVSF